MRRIRKDDQVQVIAGKDAGKSGRVVKLFLDRDRVLVEGVNYVKKHQRIQSQRGGAQEGGIIETEAPVHMSNVMAWCEEANSPSPIRMKRLEDGTRVRVYKVNGETLND